MFSDTITYEDFDGNQQTDTVFFNLSQSEALRFETSKEGGYSTYMENILSEVAEFSDEENEDESNEKDYDRLVATTKMLNVFEEIILEAYGEKSDDGKRFMKSEEITNNFRCSAMYDVFVMKLTSDPEYALNFIISVLPNTTGMSSEELKERAALASSVETNDDLNERFKAKIEEKKSESRPV